MKNKQFNKPFIARTGKDIRRLLDAQQKPAEPVGDIAITGPTETALYNIWSNLLLHGNFGRNDDFFTVGGNSLKAVQMVSRISGVFQVDIRLTEIFYKRTIAELSEYIDGLNKDIPRSSIALQPRSASLPLSFSQERLWFIDRMQGTVQYHIPALLRLRGPLDINALEHALKTIVERHEILRTVIVEQDGKAYQQIIDPGEWKLNINKNNSAGTTASEVLDSVEKPFDLSADYMLRAELTKVSEDEHILLATMHHIASDGWSMSILVSEVVELYSAFTANRSAELPELRIQYADYALWQKEKLKGDEFDRKVAYWKEKLEGVTPLQLHTDFPRPPVWTSKGSLINFHFDANLSASLQALSKDQGATMFMTLLAAFNVLIYRYSGQEDFVVGSPVANRMEEEVENLIGFFVNTIALRSNIKGEDSFSDHLQQVKATTLGAYEHQEVPFEKLVETIVKERDMSRNALFQVMMIVQNTPDLPELRLGEVKMEQQPVPQSSAKFDITLSLTEKADGIHGSVEYSTDLYREQSMRRMIQHFESILHAIVNNPAERISRLKMLRDAEESKLLHQLNNTFANYRLDKTVHKLFEEQVSKTPAATALISADIHITYQELNDRANRFAHYLQSRGAVKNAVVAISIDRSIELVVGLLAILKSGCAYLPVDPEYPSSRVAYILDDSKAELLVTTRMIASELNLDDNIETLYIEEHDRSEKWPAINPGIISDVETLFCVIYTSGSSGKPKGVKLAHEGIVNRLNWMWDKYPFAKDEVSAIKTSIGFVDHVWELFGPLASGIPSVIFTKDELLDLDLLVKKLSLHHISRWVLVPSLLRTILAKLKSENKTLVSLKLWTSSGEELTADLVSDFYEVFPASSHRLLNIYGSSEVTADVTFYECLPENSSVTAEEKIPIGKPLSNCQVYLLDKDGTLVPEGMQGEIHVGGIQVGKGYHNRPELTAEKFVDDIFKNKNSGKLYRTGDLGQWLPDGNLAYLGRIDNQVKIRGYRIELGEIENVLSQAEFISQVVILAKADAAFNKRLVGYVIPAEGYSKEAAMDFLSGKLPDYMIPQVYVELEKFPLTPNGKTDKQALPDPGNIISDSRKYVAPTNITEEKLTGIWQELLHIPQAGINDNFFELGGHSLLAMRLISQVRKELNADLSIRDLFSCPTISGLAKRLKDNAADSLPAISPDNRPEWIPLSFSQERLWFIDKLEGSAQYHVPSALRLKGKLNIPTLEHAFRQVVNRHEVLRTVYLEENSGVYQSIRNKDEWKLNVINSAEYKNDAASLKSFIKGTISRPFDLASDDMLRVDLIILSEDEHLLIVVMHHIASDGWSMPLMVREVTELYNSKSNDRSHVLQDLKLQYADYAIWQRKVLDGKALNARLEYWKHKLIGAPPLQLPLDFARPAVQTNNGSVFNFKIDSELSKEINNLSLRSGSTLFMTMLAAFKLLLARYTNQSDITVGTPVANRQQRDIELLIGFFVNTLALRTTVNNHKSFSALLESVKNTTVEAYEHQELPFEKVVEAVVRERDLSRSPLFQVMFVFQNDDPAATNYQDAALSGITVAQEDISHDSSMFDLTLFITETKKGFKGLVEYNNDLFRESSIERMMTHFTELLRSITSSPDTKVGRLNMLAASEKKIILNDFNDTRRSYASNKTIVDLFEEQVEKTPDATAVVFEDEKLSYRDLNSRVNQLANYLIAKGVGAETLVPVCMERGLGMITAILGILKSGGAYVPIDPEYPEDRISYMLEDTAARIIISSKASRTKPGDNNKVTVISPDEDKPEIEKQSPDNPAVNIAANGLAYVIYTSGSTGKPKGVMIEHRNLYSFICWSKEEFASSRFDVVFASTSMCFDLSVYEMFYPLVTGKRVRIVRSGLEIQNYLDRETNILTNTVPVVIEHLLKEGADLSNISVINMAGEPISAYVQERLDADKTEVRNLYGPTEDTTYSTIFRIKNNEAVLIGKPISNSWAYILNEEGSLVPRGIAGEICLGGSGLARGYLNMPERTAEKFIADPFHAGERLYRTGDLGRWLAADGNIEYLGRIDDQVKVRGYRIELGEIETVLLQSGMVSQAVVIAKADHEGTKRLVAYVAAATGFSREEAKAHLAERLPEYMVPQVWVELEALPLTPNGKIDKKALPDPEASAFEAGEFVGPGTETEKQLAGIWQSLLGLERISIHDNFFELGGHSLLAMRMLSRLRTGLDIDITIRELFSHATIASLSKQIEFGVKSSLPVIRKQPGTDYLPLSFSQERLWFLDKMEGSVQYHLPAVLKLNGGVNVEALEQAFIKTVDRHEVLRTVYLENRKGEVYQSVKQEALWKLDILDLQGLTIDRHLIDKQVNSFIGKSFELSNDHMLRAQLIRISVTESLLVVVMHHIAADGWSLSLLVNEVSSFYDAAVKQTTAIVPELSVQYADYAIWQRSNKDAFLSQLEYWKQKLAEPEPLQLPIDFERPALQTTKGALRSFNIDKTLSEKLEALGSRNNATAFMTMLTAFNVLLHRYTGQSDIIVGTPVANRKQEELQQLIGFFVNTLAIRAAVNGYASFTMLLEQLREAVVEAYDNQDVPFEQVVEAVVHDRELSRSPLFQVMFVLENEVEQLSDLHNVTVSAQSFAHHTSKFELTLFLSKTTDGLSGSIEYNTDLFEATSIDRLINHFTILLGSITDAPDQAVGKLNILTGHEQHLLINDFNSNDPFSANGKTIIQLFNEQVILRPSAIALRFAGESVAYDMLNSNANKLANYLISNGVTTGSLVPVCMERNIQLVTALLAIMKAGAAYVPVDPAYPEERISYMLSDTGAKLMLTDIGRSEGWNNLTGIKIIEIDGEHERISSQANSDPKHQIAGTDLAYVIYTSGSTGLPKGVMIEHHALSNLIAWHDTAYEVNQTANATAMAGIGFDGFGWELWPYLAAGASVTLVTDNDRVSPEALTTIFEENRINHSFIATALIPDFLKHIRNQQLDLKYVLTGGDKLPSIDLSEISFRLINNYGPTENTVVTSFAEITINNQSAPPIGRPIANTRVYILNKQERLVPVGAAGEICISGSSLARGYLNRKELTNEKFILNPFDETGNSRLYKTGDLGRWTSDGNLEYLGRIDEQVKIRGYRIELGEIESLLLQSPMIKNAVVIASQDTTGFKRLVAYVVKNDDYTKDSVKAFLAKKLPGYMIPQIWIELDSIPLTANGKTDKKALPDPDTDELASSLYTAPSTDDELILASIWQELLGIERIGVHDNFFELGGHSLLAMRLIAQVRDKFGVELSVKDLFKYPTVSAQAGFIGLSSQNRNSAVIESKPRPDLIPVSFSQERLWFVDKLEGSVQYHIPAVLSLTGRLNIDALENSLRAIIHDHEILRSTYIESDGSVSQKIIEENAWKLGVSDQVLSRTDHQKALEGFIEKPFDLSTDFMLRAKLFRISNEENLLVVVLHHIASDAWSVPIIVKQVSAYYNDFANDVVPGYPKPAIQFADYSIWQREYLQGELLESQVNYWKRKLEDISPLQLPTDYSRPVVRSTKGASLDFKIDAALTKDLHNISRIYDSSLYMTLLTCFNIMLHRYSGQDDVSVGTSIANRNRKEINDLVGFFVNTLTLRSNVEDHMLFSELLQQVKTTTLEAYDHQDLPFEKVVESVSQQRDVSRTSLFQVMLVLVNKAADIKFNIEGIDLKVEPYNSNISKFDFTFFLTERNGVLEGVVEYSTEIYHEDTIKRMIGHFIKLIESTIKDPNKKLSQLEMLTDHEQQELLIGFNSCIVDYPGDKTIIELFEQNVKSNPSKTALVFRDKKLSFIELNEQANRLAHYLLKKGIKPGGLVPLFYPRSAEMIIGMLGILKAGAAYVPIDPDFPADRIMYMLDDCNASVIVSSEELENILSGDFDVIDPASEILETLPTHNPARKPAAADLAYVIYTSGSTGKPKGVMIEHRSLVDYVFGLNQSTGVSSCESYALVSTIATDLGNTVIFSFLAFGGALHVFSKDEVSNAAYLKNYFRSNSIDCLKIVPSHWKALSGDEELLLPFKLLIFGGEALHSNVVESIAAEAPALKVINHYGPTETTIGKLLHVISNGAAYGKLVPVGKPFSNATVYILSKDKMPCPVGVPGQLFIAGDGVARGYLNNDELTDAKFLSDPFFKDGDRKMYATGDLVRYLASGDIEFIGRVDDQVKIRGYRIEPGEIEAIIRRSEYVNNAVVIPVEDKYGEKKLVAYIVPGDWYEKETLEAELRAELPEYMLPSMFIEIDAMPLTANGKINRKALPDPSETEHPGNKYEAPRNPEEEKLAAIWQDVLEVEQVGIHDDFFELGGHSLLAVRLISAIRKVFQVEMPISDIFDFPTIADLATQLTERTSKDLLPVIPVQSTRPEQIPLSFSQERLWFIDRLEGSVQYHVPAVLMLSGKPDINALNYALQTIIERHEVLRTVFNELDGHVYQSVNSSGKFLLPVINGNKYLADKKGLEEYIREFTERRFNLSKDLMIRATLITLSDEEHVLVVVLHHIASDAWSRSVLVTEVSELYNSYKHNASHKLASLKVQYPDYAIWQRDYYTADLLKSKLNYWKQKLSGLTNLDLPTDFQRPAFQTYNGDSVEFSIDKSLASSLNDFSLRSGATLFMTLLAAFKALLYRYTNQQDICVGTPVAGRQQQEVENLIGFFINTVALRNQVQGNMSFKSLVEEIRKSTLEAFEYQDVPFEKIVEVTTTTRDLTRSPVFQVMFMLLNAPETGDIVLDGIKIIPGTAAVTTSKYDLTLSVSSDASGLKASFEYNTDIFKRETIERMVFHFSELLESVIAHPAERIDQLKILTEAEHQKLLIDFNNTAKEYPAGKTVLSFMEEQAEKTPDQVAVIYGESSLTYKELNERANQVAMFLLIKGVMPGSLVPVCLERGFDMIIAIWGIFKAGAAYVPIDPDYPEDRISYMLEDTRASLIITNEDSKVKLQESAGVTIVSLDAESRLIAKQDNANLNKEIQANGLAYVIYTSGSTGKPKGAMNEHGGLVNRLLWAQDQFSLTAADAVFQKTTFSFDVSVWELIWPLMVGAKLVFAKPGGQKDNAYLKQLIQEHQITIMHFVPSMLEVFLPDIQPGECNSLRTVICSGEALKPSQLRDFYDKFPYTELHNLYGPTEAAIDVSSWTAAGKDIMELKSIPIGKPVANTQLHILNAAGELAPIGIAGELHIGGVQVGRGYWNNPALTNERFIDDDFTQLPGKKLYKTGDLARWLPDGNIDYLGRIDDQVKIRGYRIELGEIETVLSESGLVQQVVVITRETANSDKQLVAYVVSDQAFNRDWAKQYLLQRLPEYMVPQVWVSLDEMPLTPNGKVDKKALPDAGIQTSNKEFLAPQTPTEIQVAEIWQQLLNLDRVSLDDNFFEVGGHSLMAMRFISAIRNELHVELSIRELFTHPTVGELAFHITEHQVGSLLPSIQLADRRKLMPLSYSQERLWFIDQLEGSSQYHIPAAIRLKGTLDKKALGSALAEVVNRHETLRTVFLENNDGVYQEIKAKHQWELKITELESIEEKHISVHEYIADNIATPFNISKDQLLRAELIVIDNNEFVLFIVMHHIISDGWSLQVIMREVAELYNARQNNRDPILPELHIQYADYAVWQRKYLSGEILEHKLTYWKNKLQSATPLQLPTDKERPAVQTTNGLAYTFTIPDQISVRLQNISQESGTTMFMSLLAVFKVLLHRYSGQQEIIVGSPVSNRQMQEVENLVGFFVNTLVLRTTINPGDTFRSLLQQLGNSALDDYQKQDVPFEKIVEAVVRERDMSRNPLFQVMFIFENELTAAGERTRLDGIRMSAEPMIQRSSKFDLSLFISEFNGSYNASFEYNTDLFETTTIERMAVHFTELLRSITSSPDTKVGRLNMLAASEQKIILNDFNDTRRSYASNKTIVDLFEEQVEKTPDATAVVFEDEKLSYRDLNSRVNQLANYLIAKGVGAETLVPVCMERGLGMITAILGILKSGGAYVPIDPEYPEDRISYMLEDTAARIIISSKASRTKPGDNNKVTVISPDEDKREIEKQSPDNPAVNIAANGLAYVIYTSGSTGKPKGVMIEHRNLYSFICWSKEEFASSRFDVVFASTSMCFDLSVYEMFYPLVTGKRVRIVRSGLEIQNYLDRETNILTNTVPVVIEHLLKEGADLSNISVINMAGEPISAYVQERLDADKTEVRNLYGPTEDTTYSTIFRIKNNEAVLIGKPISNSWAYILNEEGSLVPRGIAGEICLGGSGLARGYLNMPELTAEKFIADPFHAGERLYRTGDLGRWLAADGNIEYLGRIDDQVKVRGYRIELGEIETVLLQSGMVSQAVVVAKADHEGTKRLVAYVAGVTGFSREEAKAYLAERLPEYMVPQVWVELEALPLTPNGKIDKKALPDPEASAFEAGEYVAPASETEIQLAEIWQSLLGQEQISIHDNFFELGGHSLLAMRMLSRLRNEFSSEISLRDLFKNATIASLSLQLGKNETSKVSSIQINERPAKLPLSFSQERLWFIDKFEGSVQYQIPAILKLKGELNLPALENAFRQLVNRHEVLRTVFIEEAGNTYQHINIVNDWKLANIDGSEFSQNGDQLQKYIKHSLSQPFDLAKDHMLRAELIHFNELEHILVINLHHIAGDAWSLPIVIREIGSYYNAFVDNREPALQDLSIQYADYAVWQRNYLDGDVLQTKLDYWTNKLENVLPLELPLDHPRPAVQTSKGDEVEFVLDASVTSDVKGLAKSSGATLFMTMIGAFKVLLHRYTGQSDITIGTPIANRQYMELESLIGFFVNTLAIRSDIDPDITFSSFSAGIKVNYT